MLVQVHRNWAAQEVGAEAREWPHLPVWCRWRRAVLFFETWGNASLICVKNGEM